MRVFVCGKYIVFSSVGKDYCGNVRVHLLFLPHSFNELPGRILCSLGRCINCAVLIVAYFPSALRCPGTPDAKLKFTVPRVHETPAPRFNRAQTK